MKNRVTKKKKKPISVLYSALMFLKPSGFLIPIEPL